MLMFSLSLFLFACFSPLILSIYSFFCDNFWLLSSCLNSFSLPSTAAAAAAAFPLISFHIDVPERREEMRGDGARRRTHHTTTTLTTLAIRVEGPSVTSLSLSLSLLPVFLVPEVWRRVANRHHSERNYHHHHYHYHHHHHHHPHHHHHHLLRPSTVAMAISVC